MKSQKKIKRKNDDEVSDEDKVKKKSRNNKNFEKNNKTKGSDKKSHSKKSNGKQNKKNKGREELDEEEEEKNDEDWEDLLLPGQKHPTPPIGDASRAFYESLLEQKPNSIMALKWCVEYGCLDLEKVNFS